jgi:hypothetical protein
MKCILHIGDQKNGSKSIQRFINTEKKLLAKSGMFSPATTKTGFYDAGLAAYAGVNQAFFRDFARDHRGPTDAEQMRSLIRKNLEAELIEHSGDVPIFSFEGLLHFDRQQISNLKDLFFNLFDEIDIVVFLRRQDRKAVSDFTTRLLHGQITSSPLTKQEGDPIGIPKKEHNFDYLASVHRWKDGFPSSSISVFRYEDCPDVVGVLCGYLGLKDTRARSALSLNPAMSAAGQAVMLYFNEVLSKEAPFKNLENKHLMLRQEVRKAFPGRGLLPSRAQAEVFYGNFRDDNIALGKLVDTEDEDFFDNDFSNYPVEIMHLQVDETDARQKFQAALDILD